MTRSAICMLLAAALYVAAMSCRTPREVEIAPPFPNVKPVAPVSWVDSVLATMTLEEKVGQLVMVSVYGHYISRDSEQYARLEKLVCDKKLGGLIFWQGDVYETALLLNRLQDLARVPLLVGADMERGPAMRLRRSTVFPDAMAIAATCKPEYAYATGRMTAEEARAVGIHQNYAPVADINTNPGNPVINTRSFGDDVHLVREMVAAFVRGTNDGGMVSTAKHFPGHGDTGVDSHLDLPLVHSSRGRLDSVELSPFRAAAGSGVKSIMIAHLSVPALDSSGAPASVSRAVVQGVLRDELHFDGLIVTDAMEMRGVTRGYSVARSTVMAIQAGVDMILMPLDEEIALTALLEAVRSGDIPESRIDTSVRRVLRIKEWLGLGARRTVDVDAIANSVAITAHRLVAKEIARNAVTILRNEKNLLPLQPHRQREMVVLVITDTDDYRTEINRPGGGLTSEPAGAYLTQLIQRRNGPLRTIRVMPGCTRADMQSALKRLRKADLALIPLYVKVRSSSGSVGIPSSLRKFVREVQKSRTPLVVISFGNPYVVESFPRAKALVCSYGDAEVLAEATVEALFGEIDATGKLPVSVSRDFPSGSGLTLHKSALRREDPTLAGFDANALKKIDDVVVAAIRDSAFPAAQVLVAKDGVVIYSKAFGTYTYDRASREISSTTLFDLASLTKVVATTAAAMKLNDQGKLGLDDLVAKYLPQFRGGPKGSMTIRHLLTHQAGFPPFRPFFEFCKTPEEVLDSVFSTPLVAAPGDSTMYSDLGMITLGRVIEIVAGSRLSMLLAKEFYEPLGMVNTMFNPPENLRPSAAPTELDTVWRKRLVQGTVHDENAAALGGVAGHAGLFSTADDLSLFMQMLLDKGTYAGRRFLSAATVEGFIGSHGLGERLLGWNIKAPHGSSAGDLFSPSSYGHTGFTGTSIWVDPERNLFVIFLTNRVYPTRENDKIAGVRRALHDAVIRAVENPSRRGE